MSNSSLLGINQTSTITNFFSKVKLEPFCLMPITVRELTVFCCLCGQEDWSLFMVTKYRTIKLQMTEFDEEFSEEHAEGTEVRAQPFSKFVYTERKQT